MGQLCGKRAQSIKWDFQLDTSQRRIGTKKGKQTKDVASQGVLVSFNRQLDPNYNHLGRDEGLSTEGWLVRKHVCRGLSVLINCCRKTQPTEGGTIP